MKTHRNRLWVYRIALTFFGMVAIGIWLRFFAPGLTQQSGYLTIRRSQTSVAQVAKLLQKGGFVDGGSSIKEYARLRSVSDYKPGRYFIENRMSVRSLHALLASGRQTPLDLVIRPCSGPDALIDQLSSQLEADRSEWKKWFASKEHLEEIGYNRENWTCVILPNTYEVYWTIKPEAFTRRMIKESETFWKGRRDEWAAARGLSRTQTIALASIVEWETKQIDEMPRVAGLYLNRLRDGWKLESDPTVIRAIELTQGRKNIRRVLSSDLKINSPYNTYRNQGLPPGPISIPSTQAIDAVLKAEDHGYFFMVASTERRGYHEFAGADEYSKHLEYARRYHRFLNGLKSK